VYRYSSSVEKKTGWTEVDRRRIVPAGVGVIVSLRNQDGKRMSMLLDLGGRQVDG